jgi:hypothetical protein
VGFLTALRSGASSAEILWPSLRLTARKVGPRNFFVENIPSMEAKLNLEKSYLRPLFLNFGYQVTKPYKKDDSFPPRHDECFPGTNSR